MIRLNSRVLVLLLVLSSPLLSYGQSIQIASPPTLNVPYEMLNLGLTPSQDSLPMLRNLLMTSKENTTALSQIFVAVLNLIDKQRSELIALQANSSELQNYIRELEERYQSLRPQLDNSLVELQSLQSKLIEVLNELQSSKSLLMSTQQELINLREQLETLRPLLDELQKSLLASQQESEQLRTLLEQSRASLEKALTDLQSSEESRKKLSELLKQSQAEVAGLRNDLEELKKQLTAQYFRGIKDGAIWGVVGGVIATSLIWLFVIPH